MTTSRSTFKGSNVGIEPPLSANSPTASASVIWLDALVRSLDLPLQERQQIRDELQSHIDDRVRDLILEGTDEGEATRRALSECGEASSLASGFSEVKKALRRRTLMNIGVVGAACGLVALGFGSFKRATVAVCPPEELAAIQRTHEEAVSNALAAKEVAGQAASRYYLAQGEYTLALQPTLKDAGPKVEFKDVPMEEVLTTVSKDASRSIVINWAALSAAGVERNTLVDITMPIGDLHAVVERLNEVLASDPDCGPGPIAIRERADGQEIVSTAWLDKREAKLMIYDISNAAEIGANPGELVQAITQFIEPSNWKENGGDRAEMTVVGNRLLVKAPGRIHAGVKWMLSQFGGEELHTGAATSPGNTRNFSDAISRWYQTQPAAPISPIAPAAAIPQAPEEPREPAEPAAPAEVTPPSSKPVVLNFILQHSDATLVSELLRTLSNRSEKPLAVQVIPDAGSNRLLIQGTEADAVQCQQIAAVIDSALGQPPQITKNAVPVLGDLPLLNNLFRSANASLTVSNQVELGRLLRQDAVR